MTIAEQLEQLANIKKAIRGAIVAKGVEIPETAPFNLYAQAIYDIPQQAPKPKEWVTVLDSKSQDLSKYVNTNSNYFRTHTFTLKPLTQYQITTDMPKDTTLNKDVIFITDSTGKSHIALSSEPTLFTTSSDGNIYISIRPAIDPDVTKWNPNHNHFIDKTYGVIIKEEV